MHRLKLEGSVNLLWISVNIWRIFCSCGKCENYMTYHRKQWAIAAKLIRNKINVQLLLRSQGLSRIQKGDCVHCAVEMSLSLSTECRPLALRVHGRPFEILLLLSLHPSFFTAGTKKWGRLLALYRTVNKATSWHLTPRTLRNGVEC